MCAAACAAPLLVLAGANAAPAAPGFVQQASAGGILALENTARAQAGCPALTENAQLTQAAQTHSNDMAKSNFFSHTGSDGSTTQSRITASGFPLTDGGEENISQGATSSQGVFDGWWNSAPHKAAILNCSWTKTGIAGAQPGNYWTQVFTR
ncbi:CAP domain-containing protein [Kitasatospora sp. NPDC058190]|uniref:CAP domain-containing protein n=1 Tax=Kitasatospora sp. NPDC058190 TaxID=3346371 RepID=UPI0036D87243